MDPFEVTPTERAALESACEAIVPSLQGNGSNPAFWQAGAMDSDTAGQILALMAGQSPTEQKEFRQLLGLLDSKLAGLLLGGQWRAFRTMSLERRARMLRKLRDSRLNQLRKAFATLKKLTTFLHYGSHRDHQNPTWAATGYRPLRELPLAPRSPIVPIVPADGAPLDCDVVVVGSGAGGGLAAGRLAEAGWDVVLLEKGPFLQGEDFSQHEAEVIAKSYEKQGAFQTADGGITIFAGSCLGGGTTINWTGAFHTPEYVLEEWARDHGLGFATGPSYRESMARVMAASHVNTENSPHNPQNGILWRGSEKLGDRMEVIARNVEGCADAHGGQACGFCSLGCRSGHKRGTADTYLARSAGARLRVVVGAAVQRVTQAGGQATGVEAQVRLPDGRLQPLQVRARRVVLSAGSIHTPAILLRSGIAHAGIGRNLYLHPTVGMPAIYDSRIEPWLGVMMSAVNKQHMRLDGNYGFWVETPPLHPGVGAMALPWESAAQHKSELEQSANIASFVVLTRDKFAGRVVLDKSGWPVVDYRLSAYDRGHMLAGIRKAFEIHRAAGAKQVIFPHAQRHSYNIMTSKMSAEAFLERMPKWGWGANQAAVFTAHQMGSCAMGGDAGRHPVDPTGQVRGVKGLFVADGSLLPTAAGVNPMMTIMAMADHVVQGLVEAGR